MSDISPILQTLAIHAGKAGRRRRVREIVAFLAVTLCLAPALVAIVSLLVGMASTAASGR